MQLSENALKWVMRLYPPFFFQRIWVRRFHKGFMGAEVKIHRSILNRNYNGSIFGGTIFAAADPIYALLFDQIFQRKGFETVVWLKSASVQYLKPGRAALFFTVAIADAEIKEAETSLTDRGRFVKTYAIAITDRHGETCAIMQNEVYIKDARYFATKQTVNT
ncbi:PaaI family thioesterase [Parapedobacter sp. DT-150]|uniref:PaaI family thioesterase n=1 Tax=Parapedobacter sp. DT-150 TaxID=3396162 RepID=UPI003F1D986B